MNQIDFRAGRLAEPMLELDGVGKTYRIGHEVAVEALRGVTLSIWPGEFVAIMGPSGSGKSTLMNILGCLDKPSIGSYRVFGRDVAEMDSDALAALRRDAFGFIFQGYNLLPTVTAEENVEIPAIYAGLKAAARKERADALLTRLGMGDRLHHKPNQLSGGQQQRVCIARALMNGGRIILADEPTGALDSKSGADVMALLKGFAAEGHTVILITHDAKVAAYADRVIEIADGVIAKDDGGHVSSPPPNDARMPRIVSSLPRGGGRNLGAGLLAGDFVYMAVRALRANIFRTVLTLLGIVIGVASVVTMLAIGEGSRQQMVAQIGQMGTNLLIVRPQFRNGRGYSGAIATLNEQDAQEIAKLPFVNSALPVSNSNATVRAGNIDYQTQITSTTPALPRTRSWPVANGIFFDSSDQSSFATVAVLGQTVKGVLFPGGENPIGQYVLINNVPFQVIGVMTAKGASANGNDSDDVIFVPLSTGMLRISGENFIRSVTVAVSDLSKMAFVQDAVTRLITARHNGAEDFQIRNLADVIQAASAEQDTMTLLLGSVAAISLLVGGIGIMNIMLVSVVERTREIGIRMATGARQRDVLRQFLAEAILVSGLGGVAGVIAGVAAAYMVRGFGTPTAFTPGPMLLAFGCATVTGLVFGYAPARKAARLDPVVALSSD